MNRVRFRSRLRAGAGSGSVVAPLRYVTSGNQFLQIQKTFSGVLLGNAYKDIHYVGSSDVNSLYVEHNNVALGQTAFSPFTVPELWITVDGNATGVAVTWSGSTSTTVAAGAARYRSDPISIVALGFPNGILPRGTKLWVGGRTEAAVSANIPGVIHRNPLVNSALQYTPGSTTITNLQGSTAMNAAPGAGTQSTSNNAYGLPTLVGTFVSVDPPVFGFVGDSITMGFFSGAQTYSPGASYRALFDNFATFSNPRAGIVIARVGSSATDWGSNGTVTAALAAICPAANIYIERFGINSITSDLGSAGAAILLTARKTNVWATIRANPNVLGRAPKIYALPLTPHVLGAPISAISGDTTTVTLTVPASFVTSIGVSKAGCTITGMVPAGYNASGVTLTAATATTVTYPNATTGAGTTFGTVNDGFTTTVGQYPVAGCGNGQEADFVNTQMVTLAAGGAPNGPDFYVDDTMDIRSDSNSANVGWFVWAAGSVTTVEGLHPNDTVGYPAIAARQRTLLQSIV